MATPGSSFTPTPLGHEENVGVRQPSRTNASQFVSRREICELHQTATAGSDVVQSGRPIFNDFFKHLWPYIGNNTANVVFQMVKRLWLIRIDQ
ncbi:hypothetical protein TNCV_3787871 [Trichonephila clavipes]|nr:hypothetical protein TNCV_3787871 [Trichonephila clavipes]